MEEQTSDARHQSSGTKLREGVMGTGCDDVVTSLCTPAETNDKMSAPASRQSINEAPLTAVPETKAKNGGVNCGVHSKEMSLKKPLPPSAASGDDTGPRRRDMEQ